MPKSGAFIVDPLNHYFGCRGEIFITACILTATPIASGFAQSWQGLFAVRFGMGIGIGAKNATVPIYSAENGPPLTFAALLSCSSNCGLSPVSCPSYSLGRRVSHR